MKFKTVFYLLICIVVGIAMGKFLLVQYEDKEELELVSKEVNKAYFIQQGVYSSIDSMKENTSHIPYYVYEIIDDKYYVYVALIKNQENLEKVKGYFQDLNYNIYVKEKIIDSDAFMIILEQYEEMLKNTNDNASIGTIINQVLAKYEEVVNKDEY